MAHCDYDCCAICDIKLTYKMEDSATKGEICVDCLKKLREQNLNILSVGEFIDWVNKSSKTKVLEVTKSIGFNFCSYPNKVDDVVRNKIGDDSDIKQMSSKQVSDTFEQSATLYLEGDESVGIWASEAEITTNVSLPESEREEMREKFFEIGEILFLDRPTRVTFADECPECMAKGYKEGVCVNKGCIVNAERGYLEEQMIVEEQEIAEKIRNWDKEDIEELKKMLDDYYGLCDEGSPRTVEGGVDIHNLPTYNVPVQYATNPVWAMDKQGLCLISKESCRIREDCNSIKPIWEIADVKLISQVHHMAIRLEKANPNSDFEFETVKMNGFTYVECRWRGESK